MADNFNVIGIGEILWDMLPTGKQLGGAPANFAYHAQMLGVNSFPVSSVGSDDLGSEILQHLDSIKLNKSYVQPTNDFPTGTVEVTLDNEGKPEYIIHENVAWDNITPAERLIDLAKKTDAVCFGSLAQRSEVSRETIRKFLTSVPQNSLKIFDINLRQNFYTKEIVRNSLNLANSLKLNDEELLIVADLFDIIGNEDEILFYLIENYDLNFIALTKGEGGSFIYNGTDKSVLPTPKVKVVDTVGAGDSFTAALVVGYLNKLPMNTIHNNASNLAAFVCEQKGATPSYTENVMNDLIEI